MSSKMQLVSTSLTTNELQFEVDTVQFTVRVDVIMSEMERYANPGVANTK